MTPSEFAQTVGRGNSGELIELSAEGARPKGSNLSGKGTEKTGIVDAPFFTPRSMKCPLRSC